MTHHDVKLDEPSALASKILSEVSLIIYTAASIILHPEEEAGETKQMLSYWNARDSNYEKTAAFVEIRWYFFIYRLRPRQICTALKISRSTTSPIVLLFTFLFYLHLLLLWKKNEEVQWQQVKRRSTSRLAERLKTKTESQHPELHMKPSSRVKPLFVYRYTVFFFLFTLSVFPTQL